MPELPEVQTVVNGLNEKVIGKKIAAIIENRLNTISFQDNLKICEFGKIIQVSRKGKYIVINTDLDLNIVVHLRMTGKLIFEENSNKTSSHCRAEIIFSDNSKLIFDDVRTFGTIDIIKANNIDFFKNVGIEPLSHNFSVEFLKNAIKSRTTPIKNFLLNQKIIAGLGNIYVCEILYKSGIHPAKATNKISLAEMKKIVTNSKKIMKKAIKYNGTTISDYRSIEDKTGEFQKFLQIYQKKTCPKNHKVNKLKLAGRNTFYCPVCQKK